MIDTLGVHNFKAFQDQVLEIAPLTVLTGLNGSGKSSLLQAILLLRQAFDSQALRSGLIPINGEYVRLGGPADVRNESLADDETRLELLFTEGEELKIAFTFPNEDERVATAVITPANLPNDGLFGANFVFLAADRISPQTFYDVPTGFSYGGRLGIHGERTVHYLSQFGSTRIALTTAAHPTARSSQLVHQVEAWLGEVSPGVQIHLDSQSALDIVSLSYSFLSRRDVSEKYRATNVGFGVTYVLPVITAILGASPGDLILIESPEAHLHPRGQTRLADLFSIAAQSGVQILIETHSDHLLNGIRVAVHQDRIEPGKIRMLYFRWNPLSESLGTTVETIVMDENGRIGTWPEGFFDEFDKSLDVLLTPKPRQ